MTLGLVPANVRSGDNRIMHREMLGIYLGQNASIGSRRWQLNAVA
jgi:hypothetical protein